jgi:hypothetical protein
VVELVICDSSVGCRERMACGGARLHEHISCEPCPMNRAAQCVVVATIGQTSKRVEALTKAPNSSSPTCPCQIHDIGIVPAVGQVHATIIFDKNCPVHGHIGR